MLLSYLFLLWLTSSCSCAKLFSGSNSPNTQQTVPEHPKKETVVARYDLIPNPAAKITTRDIDAQFGDDVTVPLIIGSALTGTAVWAIWHFLIPEKANKDAVATAKKNKTEKKTKKKPKQSNAKGTKKSSEGQKKNQTDGNTETPGFWNRFTRKFYPR